MSANLPRVIPGGSESAAHLSALEAAHLRVEICSVALEVIIAEPLSDLGDFSCVRLRLRKANVARTHAALDAARHLIRGDDPLPEFLEPKQRELNQSQSVSQHVQYWDLHRIQKDWAGYCHATRRILRSVRELVVLEKRWLCTPMRDRMHR